ncbi:MAG TPA: SHOCT domain-containing protein [Candidatus Limnocylindria bacterium]|jgi:uncharacterized membrane protein
MPDMTGMMSGAMMGWMMVLVYLLPLLLVGLLAVLLAWVIRSGRPGPQGVEDDAPLAILQRRYARGDIGADEYERIRSAVTKV